MKPRLPTGLLVSLVVALSAFPGVVLYRLSPFPDRVRVAVTGLPAGADFACLVADVDGVPQLMYWFPSNEIGPPSTMHPADCVWSRPDGRTTIGTDWHAYVRWRWGRRYGVAFRDSAQRWHVTWVPAGRVEVSGRIPFAGGGRADFDLTGGETVPLTAQEVGGLRLDKWPRDP
jgi:hypothetical protein